jgi:cardiolipin synthase A/B
LKRSLINAAAALGAAVAVAGCGALTAAASPAPAASPTAAPTATATSAAALQLVSEPQSGSKPFVAMIAAARTSVTLTMYELTDPVIEQALAAAAKRGVTVRVLLNGGYYDERDDTNTAAYSYLRAHAVQVRWSPSYFALTHQKTLTIDDSEAAVMTLNFDGLYATTRDFAILDRQPADVRAITQVFDADWQAKRTTPSTGTGDLVWSPGAGPTVLKLINRARSSIELENEEMDYSPATDALCAAARRGVNVKIVMTYSSDWSDAFSRLTGCGAHVRVYYGQRYYIHAKILLVDGRAAMVSSQNLSYSSLDDNRELGITITSQPILGQLATGFSSDYAGATGVS